MTVTLATVAARAGVSPATVSRVLNNNYPVAAETRRRVEKAVRELDYVVNAHDLMAAGALATFREAGVRVPEDVSVVGMDDILLSPDLAPALTTVRLPLAEAGRQAVALAFAGEQPVRPVALGHELVIRSSTASPGR